MAQGPMNKTTAESGPPGPVQTFTTLPQKDSRVVNRPDRIKGSGTKPGS